MNNDSKTTYELVFGKNPVLEVIENSTLEVNKIWLSEKFSDKDIKQRVLSYAKEKKIPFHIVHEGKINKLTNNQNHQGLVLSISPIKYLPVSEIIQNTLESSSIKVILVAHEIEDTHNLGAMIRTFVAAGGKSIILTGRKNLGINSTAIKTSAGALFQAKFARTVNCVNVLNELKESGFWVAGTDISSSSESIYRIDYPDQLAILIGNEQEGLGQLVKKNCDYLVKIPINERVNSLNASVAFGILLFEVIRQKSLT